MATLLLNESSDKLTIANVAQYKTIQALKTYIATTLKDTLLADEIEDMEFTTNEDRIITDYKDIGTPLTKKSRRHSTSNPCKRLWHRISLGCKQNQKKETSRLSPQYHRTCSRNFTFLNTYSMMDSRFYPQICYRSMI